MSTATSRQAQKLGSDAADTTAATSTLDAGRPENRPLSFTVANRIMSKQTARWHGHIGAGFRQMHLPNIWITIQGTWDDFAASLERHAVRQNKDGFAFIPGTLKAGSEEDRSTLKSLRHLCPDIPPDSDVNLERCNANVTSVTMLVLDYDKGTPFDDVVDRIRGHGLEFVAYTSYSHGKSKTILPKRKVVQFNNADNNVTEEAARRYLAEVSGYVPEIAQTAIITAEEQDAEGVLWLVIDHAPMDKFRVVIPLATPYVGDAAGWHKLYRSFAEMLGFPYDKAGSTLSQAFYFPSRKPDGMRGRCVRGRGSWLDFSDWRKEMREPKEVLPKASQGSATRPPLGSMSPRYTGKLNLFDVRIASIIAEHASDVVASSSPKIVNGGTKVQLVCPLADDHTQVRGKITSGGCWAQDPETGKRYGIVRCRHDHCTERLTEEFVEAWIADGTLDANLFAPKIVIPAQLFRSASKTFKR